MKIRFIVLISTIFLLNCSRIQIEKWPIVVDEMPDWTISGRTIARSHHYPGKISFPLELVKHIKTSAAVGKTLIASQGLLFYTTMDGIVHSYNLLQMEEIGEENFDLHSTLAIKDSILIIGRRYGDDTLFGFNLNSGEVIWQTNAGDLDSEPLIFGDKVIVTALYKHIDEYSIFTGNHFWKTNAPDQIHSSPVSDGKLIFFGCDNHFVYAVDEINGKIIWRFKTEGAVQTTGAVSDETLFIGSTDGNLYALNSSDGELKWKFQTKGPILTDVGTNGSHVFFGSTDEHFYCVETASGKVGWKFKAESIISTAPLICQNAVFFGSLDHKLRALNIKNGELLWEYELKGRIRTDPIRWNNYVICASENNDIYIFQSKD